MGAVPSKIDHVVRNLQDERGARQHLGIASDSKATRRVSNRIYETILVATHGSADANHAATDALEQAEQHAAELHTIRVADTDRYAEQPE